MLKRLRLKLLGTMLVVPATLVASAAPAWAHYVYKQAMVFISDPLCVYNRSEVSHGGGGGYSEVYTSTWRFAGIGPVGKECGVMKWQAAGSIGVWGRFYKKTGSKWSICTYWNWKNNSGTTYQVKLSWDYGSRPPCGDGYYATMGASRARDGSGRWRCSAAGSKCRTIWSGSHKLVRAGLQPVADPPVEEPSWVGADGLVDLDKLPAQLPLIDAGGNPALDASGNPILVNTIPSIDDPDQPDDSTVVRGVTEDGIETIQTPGTRAA
ncbi:MAG TPA: hypothetical protein VFV66_11635 [Nonomuraea sp.]|nr:hypothetical protein [Nonomuraea sp.]